MGTSLLPSLMCSLPLSFGAFIPHAQGSYSFIKSVVSLPNFMSPVARQSETRTTIWGFCGGYQTKAHISQVQSPTVVLLPRLLPLNYPTEHHYNQAQSSVNDLGYPALLFNYSGKVTECAFMGEYYGIYRSRTDVKLYKIPSLVRDN